MKRRWYSILAALALCLCLLPMTAMAELLENVGVGETLDTVSRGNQVSQNAGTIKMNNGWISKNMATGIVENNSNMTDANSTDGLISENYGTVVSNSGCVTLNYGEVTQNKGISFNGVLNGVERNFGTVKTNQGQVMVNGSNGTVEYNEANCRVDLNEGTVKYNSGDIYSNYGTVKTMSGGTIQSNSGTVENMTGGTVYNSGGGSVTNCTGGDLWWAAEISGGENLTFTDTATVDGRTFLKPGSTLAPAGERDILKVTAENAELTPEGRGYRVTAVTAAPVKLTVETLPAVALVRVNGEDTYYADIQEAFTAAKGAGDATVELLADAALPDGKFLTVKWGHRIHLNCGDFTLSGSSGWVIGVEKGGTLEFSGGTLKNTASRFGSAVSVDGGSFIMSGGTLEVSDADTQAVAALGYTDSAATVTIRGGSVGAGGWGLGIAAYTTARLSGGTYGSIDAGSGGDYATPAQKAVTVPGLLKTGYAFFKDGKPVALEPEQHYLEGPVTVEPCTHIYEYVQTEGEETHSKVCPACGDGKDAAAESCAFENWTDQGDGTHKGVCVCGREKTGEHRWMYHTRSVDGKPLSQTVYQRCTICERRDDLGTITRTADFTVPYGQTKDHVLSVVIEPEDLVTRMKNEGVSIEWSLNGRLTDAGAFTTSYNLPENLAVGEYNYAASGDIRFPIIISIQVTVEPASLPEDKIQVAEGPFTFANKVITPEVAVEGLTEGTDYTVAYKDNFDAGTASIVITGQGNYAGTVTKTFEIGKAVLEFSDSLIVTGLTYGTPLSEAAVVAGNPPQFNGGNVGGKWEIQSEDTPDVGKHSCTAVFVPSMDTMAKNCEPLTRQVTVTVTRAHFETEPLIQIQPGRTLEYDLAAGLSGDTNLPEGLLSGTEWSAEHREDKDDNSILAKTPEAAGGKLTIQIKDTATVGQTAFVGLDLNSKNWYARLTCRIAVVDKFTPEITVPALQHTYDGQAPDLAAAISQMTAEYNGELVSGTFAIKDPESVPVHVRESGPVAVVFTPEDTENYDAAEDGMWTEILPAEITVRVESREVTQNGAMPEPAYTVEGLAPGERLKTEPTLTCEARDTATAGTYAITAAGAEAPDGGDYEAEIAYVDGTLTVRASVPPVDPDPPGPDEPDPPDPDDLEVKLEVKEGFTEVPPALRELEHLNTPEKLTQVMRTLLTQTGVPSGNTAVYDVALLVSTDGGRTWVPATPANFPSGGLTVTLPYPAGTDSGYTFTVVHMFTTAAFGKTPGDTESPAVTNTEAGLQFTVTGLSPISVGWRAKTTGTGGSSGGGSYSGGSRPMASVIVERAEHGKVTSNRSSARSGSPVTLTVQPDRGYRLESLTVTDSRGNKLQLTDKGGGKYAFTMSGGNVTVRAAFAALEEKNCPSRAFPDLDTGAWYHEAVDYVLSEGLMNGYANGTFRPNSALTRAQFAQILYNKEDRPAGAGSAPFTDVAPGAWCAPAVAWAAERGIAGGYGGGLFGPDDAITREQLAVMLWRYAGSPAAPGGELSFMDAEQIGAHAWEAICWAVESGVMNGKAGGVLDPKGLATRAQTAQMLKNFLENG